MRERILVSILILAALLSAGCNCFLTKIESDLGLPRVGMEENAEIQRMLDQGRPEMDAARLEARNFAAPLENAERCDVIDPSHCLLPFPNDHFTREDPSSPTFRRVDFHPEAMPKNAKGEGIDPEAWHASDGFSPGPLLITRVPRLDLEKSRAPSLENIGRSVESDSPVQLIDAATGERVLLWAELDHQAEDLDEQALLIRPAINLEEGKRYIVVLQDLRDQDGDLIEPSRGFLLYRDRLEPRSGDDPKIEDRREDFEEVFGLLARVGFDRRDLYLTWDFTVASREFHSAWLLDMRVDAFEKLGGRAPDFDICCNDEGYKNLGRRVWGTYQVPNYLEGKGLPGSRLNLGAGGWPEQNGSLTSYFSCIIPEKAFEKPAKLLLYGHGTLGSLSEIGAEDVRALAADYNYVICATNWLGQAVSDYLQAYKFLIDASEFPPLAERVHQGILNTLFLGRLMKRPDGLVSHELFRGRDGQPIIDTRELYFDGNSQGALLGGTATAISQDWTRAVLGVAGMNYSLILRRSNSFAQEPLGIFPSLAETFDRSYGELEQPLVLALVQMLWDRVDLNGHARHLLRSGDPDTPEKQVLIHVAHADHAVPNVASEILVRTLDVSVREPLLIGQGRASNEAAASVPPSRTSEEYSHRPFQRDPREIGIAKDLGFNAVLWDTGACPTPLENRVPTEDPDREDPHDEIRKDLDVMRQKAAFLQPNGEILDFCPENQLCFTADVKQQDDVCITPLEP